MAKHTARHVLADADFDAIIAGNYPTSHYASNQPDPAERRPYPLGPEAERVVGAIRTELGSDPGVHGKRFKRLHRIGGYLADAWRILAGDPKEKRY